MDDVEIRLLSERISDTELRSFLNRPFEDMVKFVVDIDQGILMLGGALHADAEAILIEKGSAQKNLWGGNIFPDEVPEGRIEYNALINIRPNHGNRSMGVQDEKIREKMKQLVERFIEL